MKKIILVVIDGLADEPIASLRDKTPLEAANTPNLDKLAQNGSQGLVRPFLFPGQINPDSTSCHLALLGYDPNTYYLGRGVYEALGLGIKLKEENVALRANFGTIDDNFNIIDRRAERIEDTEKLIKAISGLTIDGVKFIVKKSLGHRAVLVLKGGGISSRISDGDLKRTGESPQKIYAKDQSEEAIFTAEVLNKYLDKACQILNKHSFNRQRAKAGLLPANYLLVRGAGSFKKTESFKTKYGLRAGCIAGAPLYRGIARALGMKIIKTRGATGLPNTNLKNKFKKARKKIKWFDFIFCHIKAADSLAEDGNFVGKKDFIEKIDQNINFVFGRNKNKFILAITADHATCCSQKGHCPLKVPILIYDNIFRPNSLKKFSEKDCGEGDLGTIDQINVIPALFNRAGAKN